MEQTKTPSFENIIKAAKIIQKWRNTIGSPISLETALCFICGAIECEIIVRQCEFTIRKSEY